MPMKTFFSAMSNCQWHYHNYETRSRMSRVLKYIQLKRCTPASIYSFSLRIEATTVFNAAYNNHSAFCYERIRPSYASFIKDRLDIERSGSVSKTYHDHATKWNNTMNYGWSVQNKTIEENKWRNLIYNRSPVPRKVLGRHHQKFLSKRLFPKIIVS